MNQLVTSIDGFAVYRSTIGLAVLAFMWMMWMIFGSHITRPLAILFGCKAAKKTE